MYQTLQEFLDDWQLESGYTLALFRALTDDSLTQKVTPEGRSLGRLAWHITFTVGEMMMHSGLEMEEPGSEGTIPASTAEIIQIYERISRSLAKALKRQWTSDMLNDTVIMYGETWPRSKVLSVLIRHQVHHRGQMTVLMRQAGLKVPGVYGPSREEWAEMGMKPMD